MTRLAAVKYGETCINEGMAYKNGDNTKKVPISLIIYLIETPDQKILIDAGCDTMPGFELKNFFSPTEPLKKAGISPEEITDVILTHAHHDNAEASCHFVNATIHIEKDDYEAARPFLPEYLTVNVFENELILPPPSSSQAPHSALCTPHPPAPPKLRTPHSALCTPHSPAPQTPHSALRTLHSAPRTLPLPPNSALPLRSRRKDRRPLQGLLRR